MFFNFVMKNILLTKTGLDDLKAEYEELVHKKRPEVIARLSEAREKGDLSENAEFDAARDQQSFVEGRISEIAEILKKAKLISDGGATDDTKEIVVGSTVRIVSGAQVDEFMIVGSVEADPTKKKISNESPVGRALLGAKKGQSVTIKTPVLAVTYKILDVK